MWIHPGYAGQEFMEDAYERLARTRELVDCSSRSTAASRRRTSGPSHEAGADLLVVGTGIFGFEDLTRTYRRLVQALA